MSGYVVTWNGIASSTLDGVIFQRVNRGLLGTTRDQLVEVPGKDGAYLSQENRGNRIIVLEGVINGTPGSAGTRTARVEDFADWLDVAGYAQLVIDDYPTRYWEATLQGGTPVDEWRSLGRFTLEFSAKPYSFAVSTSSDAATGVSSGAGGSVVVADNVPAQPVIEVTANGGTMEDIVFTIGGRVLTFAGPLTAGNTVTINALSETVTAGINGDTELTGAYLGNPFPYYVAGEFPLLTEGANAWTISWTGSATSADVDFTWRRRYRR